MSASSNSSKGPSANLGSGLASIALDALPPEIQSLLKPGKTSQRIQQAITWAARPDPNVIRMHTLRDPRVKRFEDIAGVHLRQMDAVAMEIARRYRRRALVTGALTGLPGGLWAVVAAGADVQLTAIYAVRMAAQVAQAYGYDTSILEEQAHLADVLALAAGVDGLRGVGNWVVREGLTHALPEIMPRLLTRLSLKLTEEQAAKWLGRLIPGVGAAIGGAIDYAFLRAASERAMQYYHNRYVQEHSAALPPSAAAALPAGGTSAPAAAARVVEGSLAPAQIAAAPGGHAQVAAPTSAAPVHAPAPVHGGPPARVAVPARTPAPVAPTRKRQRSPERFGFYLALFAVFVLAITIFACAALGMLFYTGLRSLGL